jgi:hypothetical protein
LNKGIIYLVAVVLLCSLAFADASLFYKNGEVADIKVPCINNNTYCSPTSTCNITINYPNGSSYILNQEMTNSIVYFNYTLPDTTLNGEYNTIVYCNDGSQNGYSLFSFMINNYGDNEKPSGILAVIILIPLIMAIIFLMGGISLGVEHTAIKIFLLLLSMLSFFSTMYFAVINLTKFYNFVEMGDAIANSIYIIGFVTLALFCYFIIYLITKAIHAAALNKESKLNY